MELINFDNKHYVLPKRKRMSGVKMYDKHCHLILTTATTMCNRIYLKINVNFIHYSLMQNVSNCHQHFNVPFKRTKLIRNTHISKRIRE